MGPVVDIICTIFKSKNEFTKEVECNETIVFINKKTRALGAATCNTALEQHIQVYFIQWK